VSWDEWKIAETETDFCGSGMSSRKFKFSVMRPACSGERETLFRLLWLVGLDWQRMSTNATT
jgi:hypothetical protein